MFDTVLSGAPSGRYGSGRRKVTRFAALLAVIGLCVGPLGAHWLGSPASAASSPFPALGVYAGPANVSGANAVGQTVGHQLPYAMEFLDGSTWSSIQDPSWFLQQWAGSGYQMIWGVPILPNSGASLATGATGAYDSYFATLAQRLVAGGQGHTVIRLGWEFNGGWFPWAANGHAADFITYWQHVVTAMRSVSGAQFTFEWNPTRGDLGVGDLANYYPGDAYVDVIGLDVYDVEWANYPGAAAEWQQMQTQPYGLNWLAQFGAAHNKPLAFPEWGLGWGSSAPNSGPVTGSAQVTGGDNPYFIKSMAAWISAHNVNNAPYWDYGTSSLAGGANPKTASALASSFPASASTPSTTTTKAPTSTTKAPTTTTKAPTQFKPRTTTPPTTPPTTAASPPTTAASPPTTASGSQLPSPSGGGWTLNGNASLANGVLTLNPATTFTAGSAVWPTPVSSTRTIAFDATFSSGSGANGLTLALLDPSSPATSLGENGGGEGFAGLKGVAVSLSSYSTDTDNLVGVTDGQGSGWSTLHYLAQTRSVPQLHAHTHTVVVQTQSNSITVWIDGQQVLSVSVSLPPSVMIAFTGAAGYFTDAHAVSNVTIS